MVDAESGEAFAWRLPGSTSQRVEFSAPAGRHYDEDRYIATLQDQRILLVDDTWTAAGRSIGRSRASRGRRNWVALVVVVARSAVTGKTMPSASTPCPRGSTGPDEPSTRTSPDRLR